MQITLSRERNGRLHNWCMVSSCDSDLGAWVFKERIRVLLIPPLDELASKQVFRTLPFCVMQPFPLRGLVSLKSGAILTGICPEPQLSWQSGAVF